MDQFDIRQKDVYNFDNFMDLKKPGFGGPNSAIKFDAKKEPTQLSGWRRIVKRYAPAENGTFHPNYNGMWKAINKDRINRDAGTKSEEESKYIDDLNNGRSLPTFESFVEVFEGGDGPDKLTNDSPTYVDKRNPDDAIEKYDEQDPKKSEVMDDDSVEDEYKKVGY
jgi:hypothetical protein